MAQSDPYATLGISRSATPDDIKKAYRKLAKLYHPDIKPGDAANERRFKDITAAYTLLSDATQKSRYDRGDIDADGNAAGFGAGTDHWQSYGGRRSYKGKTRPYYNEGDPFDPNEILSDLFSNFTGKKRGTAGGTSSGYSESASRESGMKGQDINHTLSISFLEAALGGRKQVNFSRDKALAITIPPGAVDGQTLRLKGQGYPGTVTPGDALVKLAIEKHPVFSRDGNDILLDVPITLPEAILGDIITVPTIHGNVSVKIPAAANTGLVLRLRGKGIAGSVGVAGDQLIKLKVVLPETIDNELSAFIRKWAPRNEYEVRKGLKV